MTLLNYTDPVPTPAPLTSGTTVQSYTDPTGEVWVAKNGVNGGNWFRARDVLHCRWYRSAAFSVPNTAAVAVAFDTVNRDPYGIYNSGTSIFTIPLTGLYRLFGQVGAAPAASGNYLNCMLRNNGGRFYQNQVWATGTAASMYGVANDTWILALGDQMYMESYTLPNALTGATGSALTFMGIDYLGTG